MDADGSSASLVGADGSRSWTGELSRQPARRFRDGSLGDRLRFGEVSTAPQELEAASLVSSALTGLSVELRTFPSGEMLDIDLLSHLAGAPRHGDLLLPLFAACSPQIPSLDPGQIREQKTNLPFMVDSRHGARAVADISWELLELTTLTQGEEAWHFSYSGPLRGKGLDGTERWSAHYQLEGEISGEAWLSASDHQLLRNEFDWSWTITASIQPAVTDEPGQHPGGRVVQHQHHHGLLSRSGE